MVSFPKRYQFYQIGNAFNERPVALSPAASRLTLSHFFSPRLFLPTFRVTLTHFTLFSYERALPFPTSIPISGLTRLGVKPRLCRSSWRVFASTHPLMLPSTSLRRIFLLALPFLLEIFLPSPWSPPFLSMLSLRSPSLSTRCCSRPS